MKSAALVCLVNFILCLQCQFSLAQLAKKPNIVVIVADDLGYGDVGCFGNDTIQTPNIDRLGREGAIFTQALAAEAVCTPSRAALLTGRYAIRSGMTHEKIHVLAFVAQSGGLPVTETTFAKVLQQNGYSTALIGKWHLGLNCQLWNDLCHHPNKHGFDYFYGMPHTNLKDFGSRPTDGSVVTAYKPNAFIYLYSSAAVTILTALYMRQKGHRLGCALTLVVLASLLYIIFVLSAKRITNSILMRDEDIVEQPIRLSGLAQRFANESQTFIRRQVEHKQPFLLFLSFSHVHTALATAKEFEGHSRHGRYGDNIEEMDWAVGEVISTLRELNIEDDTFVAFTSDHGGHLEETSLDGEREGGHNGKLKGGKAMGGMEGGIRVPTVARYPKIIMPHTVINSPVSLMDLYPTILSIADVSYSASTDGKNVVPLLKNPARPSPHKFLFHYCGTEIHAARYIENSTHVWKVHYAQPNWLPGQMQCTWLCFCHERKLLNPPLMYNIQQDPYEYQPISSGSAKYKEVIEQMSKALAEHTASLEPVENQLTFPKNFWLPWLQPCCNFPLCQCREDLY